MCARARVATQVAMREYRRNPPLRCISMTTPFSGTKKRRDIEYRATRIDLIALLIFEYLSITRIINRWREIALDYDRFFYYANKFVIFNQIPCPDSILFPHAKRSRARSETECVFQTRVKNERLYLYLQTRQYESSRKWIVMVINGNITALKFDIIIL